MLMFIPGRVMMSPASACDLSVGGGSEGRFLGFGHAGNGVQDASSKPCIGGIRKIVERSLAMVDRPAPVTIDKTDNENDHGRDEDHANNEKNEAGNDRRSRHAIIDRIRKIHSITAFQDEKESSDRHLV